MTDIPPFLVPNIPFWGGKKTRSCLNQKSSLDKSAYITKESDLRFWLLVARTPYRRIKTRPSSDSEAETMNKLKGQSSNMQTGQDFYYGELICQASSFSWSDQLVRQSGKFCWSVYQTCNIVMLQSGNVAELQCYNLALSQCCKVAVNTSWVRTDERMAGQTNKRSKGKVGFLNCCRSKRLFHEKLSMFLI